ncbi:MAG: phage major capsid protein [Mesorhizobium sp.]|uniref:phage major capsid protein n=1 Tax=Mesorhizobium sp. TaxID=1871066 RepID=UPI0012212292|nr:phage major capsid protein [Mesorhizobium sp.]TJV53334.1 MAG: phage major capsid protein [Mesorhizobium sp.]
MLQSVAIQRRQSEIRQSLAELVGKDKPSEDETRKMGEMDAEYRANETRYRAALIAEDSERRDAGKDLETRSDREYSALVDRFEMRQVALSLDEGRALDGATAEIVQELRGKGGYRGIPVPLEAFALEQRAGETVASGTPSPKMTAPIIDRLFPASVAAQMGVQMINIAQGSEEWPLTASSVSAGWQATETGAVAGPTVYSTAQRSVAPNSTLGIQMKITRKALKQSGDALEQAVRRDMNGCMAVALDKAVFLGAGASGEPAGLLVGSYGITSTAVAAAATWAAFRAAIVRFMTDNAITGPGNVNLLIRPEVFDKMDGTYITNTAVTEWDRLVKNVSAPVMTTNALAAPTGTPAATKALLTTSIGGVAPAVLATWGAVDLVRDVFSDAASGGLRLTGLVTADVSALRAQQLQILTGVQV